MKEDEPQMIPDEVGRVTDKLQGAGFEAYLVGGCVRDLLLGKKPKDWDVATNAKPEEVEACFEHTFYENEFGTVGIVNEETDDETLKAVEVTTYRLEGAYSDKRRPDEVKFSTKLSDDLKRRDFTINAMALSLSTGERNAASGELEDPFGGKSDLKEGTIRAVGDPDNRFDEDALRILRAVRFISELGFAIDAETEKAIIKHKEGLREIATERIRDEFVRIVSGNHPAKALEAAHKFGLLELIAPELLEGVGVEQKGAHKYTVFEHLLKSLEHAAGKNYSLEVRLAALFHDIGKPATRRRRDDDSGKEFSFFGHEVVGARITKKILKGLKFPKDIIEKVTTLVRWHMFLMDTEQITLSAVRRLVSNVGKENIWELMDLRTADRIGAGRPKEKPYRLRKYQAMIEEALRSPVSVGDLKIDGNDIMKELKVKPGPKIGWVLHALLEEVLDEPDRNNKKYLLKRAEELINLPEKDLKKLGEAGKQKREEIDEAEIEKIRKKYGVR